VLNDLQRHWFRRRTAYHDNRIFSEGAAEYPESSAFGRSAWQNLRIRTSQVLRRGKTGDPLDFRQIHASVQSSATVVLDTNRIDASAYLSWDYETYGFRVGGFRRNDFGALICSFLPSCARRAEPGYPNPFWRGAEGACNDN
jgi:hypothetical protein